MTACRQVGVVSLLGELVCGEVPDSLGLQGEQEDERAGRAGLDGERLVGQAALQELPAFVVVEQVGGFRARDGGNSEPAAEAAIGCPAEEVADSVAALGVLLVEPSVEVVLLSSNRSLPVAIRRCCRRRTVPNHAVLSRRGCFVSEQTGVAWSSLS
ncbi:hypothetical protein ILP97_01520 [Amycolatopsis sp. H6(2020)]|nr:hypothetical protein [Amycolatopsis sp. H6(2020)]